MVTAHDLFTYGNVDNNWPQGDVFRSNKGLWKCQEIKEEQLYALGVRMFDLRVYWDTHRHKNVWRAAHGIVNFTITFKTLEEMCQHFDNLGNQDALYRIVLEKNENNGETEFKKQASGLCAKHPNLWTILIKSKTSNWLNDGGMVDNNIDSLVKRGYTFAKYLPWQSPNREYNTPPPNFSFGNISDYVGFDIKDHATNGFKDDRGQHDPNPNPTTLEMLTSKDFLYSMDYCYIYIGNDRCMSYGEVAAKHVVNTTEHNINRVYTKSELQAKGYKISGNYADNQLVLGKDISR